MASVTSSGSEVGGAGYVDEKKRKRMLCNRESARRSRLKKLKKLEDLTDEITKLQGENRELVETIAAKEEAVAQTNAANAILRTQTMELADRLRFLNSILEVAEEVGGFSVQIPLIPDPLLKPWQVPRPTQPIMASANMFLH